MVTATDVSGTNLSGTNSYVTTVTATNVKATTITATTVSGTDLSSTNVKATTISATTFTGTDVKVTTVTATNVSATNITATSISATNFISAGNYSTCGDKVSILTKGGVDIQWPGPTVNGNAAINLVGKGTLFTCSSGSSVPGSALFALNLDPPDGTPVMYDCKGGTWNECVRFVGGKVYTTGITASGITATNISATTYQNMTAASRTSLNFPADCWVTRSGTAGWAGYTYTQGTNLDYGQLDYDKDTDEGAFSPPFKLSNYTATSNLTANIYWKTTAVTTTQCAVWVLYGMSNAAPVAWDASLSYLASAASPCPSSTAGTLQVCTMTFSASVLDNNDPVVMKLYRNADDGTYDTMSADASVVLMNLEWA